MSEHYLSKSDFKLASDCPTKLFYKKSKYPMTTDGAEYLEFLKEGGFIVGKIAQLLHPDGVLIDKSRGAREAVKETSKLLQAERITLFEAAFESDGRLVIVDVLRKNGNRFDLVEAKSKSFDSEENKTRLGEDGVNLFHGKRGGIDSEWRPYLEDITYQAYVLRLCLPSAEIRPYLLMPDKARTTTIDKLASFFQVEGSSPYDPEVVFTGDQQALIADDLFIEVDVSSEVTELMQEVVARTSSLLAYLQPALGRAEPKLSSACRDCEFRTDEEPSGFKECWREIADVTPHILDLYKPGLCAQIQPLLDNRKASLLDIDINTLRGKTGSRQALQVDCTQKDVEHIDAALKQIVKNAVYPFYFIDFETSRVVVPYHQGMRPYEQIAFQWSCHTIERPGAPLQHAGWINLEESYPNIDFARTLKSEIGGSGTVFTWATHERSVLRDIVDQMERYSIQDAELEAWLRELTARGSRLLDMNRLTLDYYFHPEMKGRTSIKAVLPAVWRNDAVLRSLPEFKDYVTYIEGELQNPYKALRSIEIEGLDYAVREGTAAMLAYQDLLYGRGRSNPEAKRKLHDALWDYCRLDTLSMVIIWKHWERFSA